MSRAGLATGRTAAALAVLLAVAILAGCGAPRFSYATDSSAHAYFKVPFGWDKITDSDLITQISGGQSSSLPAGVWTAGYDASASPAAADLLNPQASRPFAYALVEPVNATTASSLSYNTLRDFFLPVTSTARQSAAKSGFQLTGFKQLRNTVVTPGQGVHGVRVTYDYTYPDGSTDTFDQVALMNSDATEVYVLMVHCLAACYQQYQGKINTVMTSFTVRNPR
jgi:hypothetical protein